MLCILIDVNIMISSHCMCEWALFVPFTRIDENSEHRRLHLLTSGIPMEQLLECRNDTKCSNSLPNYHYVHPIQGYNDYDNVYDQTEHLTKETSSIVSSVSKFCII